MRSASNNLDDAITIDGKGLYGIEQTCKGQRVLRDDAGGEKVTLTGLTHFTGGNSDGNGGGLRNDGPVVVVNSNVSGNSAYGQWCELSASDADAQVQCDNGDGGGIYAGESSVEPSVVGPGYDINLTNTVVADNSANDDGGGVYTEGDLTATGSQFNDNTAHGNVWGGGRGGGAYAHDSVDFDRHLVGGQRGTVWRVRHRCCGGHPARVWCGRQWWRVLHLWPRDRLELHVHEQPRVRQRRRLPRRRRRGHRLHLHGQQRRW